jgi:hypothetical protein
MLKKMQRSNQEIDACFFAPTVQKSKHKATLSISCLLALLPLRGKQASAKKVALSTKGA